MNAEIHGFPPSMWLDLEQPALGRAIGYLRAASGLTLDGLADRLHQAAGEKEVGVNGVAVWKWENGRHDVSRPYRKLLGAVCDRELGVMDLVTRREFVRRVTDLIGVGLLAIPTVAADPERLGAALNNLTPLDKQVLGDLEAITQDLARRHRATAPASLMRSVTSHFATFKGFFPEAPAHLRPRLYAATGEVAVLAGWLGWFAENRGDAEAWWQYAATLARAADNEQLRAHVLVAHSALYSTHGWRVADSSEALKMLEAAVSLAGAKAPPRLQAWIFGRLAEEHAIAGDEASAGHELDAAEHAMAVARAEEGSYAGARDAIHTYAYRGNCAMHLGHGQEAEASLRRVLEGTPDAYQTARCWSLMDLSVTQAQQNNEAGACQALAEAARLAFALRLTGYMYRARGIRQQHLSRWPDSPAVKEFDEQLRASSGRSW